MKHAAYSRDAALGERTGVFALPEPRFQPVPYPARCEIEWHGAVWRETGVTFERGRVRVMELAGAAE